MLRKFCLLGWVLTSLLGYTVVAAAQEEASSEKKEAKTAAAEDQPRKAARKLKVFRLEHCKPSELAQLFAHRHTVYSGFATAASTPGFAAPDVVPSPGSAATTPATAGSDRSTTTPPVNTAHVDEKKLLFVRGSEDQIKRIEKLVKAFDMPAAKLEKQKWEDMHLIPIRGAEAGNVQSILSQLGLATHTIQLGDASVIVLQESDDEEVEQILKVITELESSDEDRTNGEKATITDKDTTQKSRERR